MRNQVRFPAYVKTPFLQSIHPDYPNRTGGSSSGSKRRGCEAEHSHLVTKLGTRGATPQLSHTSTWLGISVNTRRNLPLPQKTQIGKQQHNLSQNMTPKFKFYVGLIWLQNFLTCCWVDCNTAVVSF
jgi:hypothetical protein